MRYNQEVDLNHLIVRNPKASDIEEIFKWRNDLDTIKYSKTRRGVQQIEHSNWFYEITSSPNTIIKVAEIDKVPVGVIIFSKINDPNNIEISINIAPESRKKGVGSNLILLGEMELLKTVNKARIVAVVDSRNKKSLKVFQKNNYEILRVDNSHVTLFKKVCR
jgi:RimJ/RimL family protein N-acetyltransferase